MSELEKLEDLYSMGFICEEEFIRRKEELGITSTPTSSDGNFNPVSQPQHDPFSFPQPEPYNPYSIPTQDEPAFDPFAMPQPSDQPNFSLSQSLSRSMNLSHASHSEPHSLASSSSNPLSNSQKRTVGASVVEALPGESAYHVHDESLRGYVFYQLTRWGSQQTPVVYGNLTLPEIAKTLETKSNIYVESIFDPSIKISDPAKPVPHGQYYVKENKNFTQPAQPAHWMRSYLDLCFREFTVYFDKGESYNPKKHKVFCASQTYRILFCFPSGVEDHIVAKALGRRHYRLIPPTVFDKPKWTGQWTDGVHMIEIAPVKHDEPRPLFSYQELLQSVPGQNYDCSSWDEHPKRLYHVSVLTLRNEFVNFYKTNDVKKIMKSLSATGALLLGLRAHTTSAKANFKTGLIDPIEVPQLPNGVYRLVLSPKGLGFQNSIGPIYHQCLDYDKHMGECYFTPQLKKSELMKRPIPKLVSTSRDKALVPTGTKLHFVLRVRELQRMHLGEGANDFEANSLMKTSLERRLADKLCVVSGQPLNDGATVSNYHDELLEQLYKNMQTKEPEPKLFPEKEIGEVDNKVVFAGKDATHEPGDPLGDYPAFRLELWLAQGHQWTKEDTWDEFEAKGRKYDYTLLSPESAVAQLSRKERTQWMAKLFENPHKPISE